MLALVLMYAAKSAYFMFIRRMVDMIDCRTEGIYIGYCPQVDALDDLMTGAEHMYFYARIRGIATREIDGVREPLCLYFPVRPMVYKARRKDS